MDGALSLVALPIALIALFLIARWRLRSRARRIDAIRGEIASDVHRREAIVLGEAIAQIQRGLDASAGDARASFESALAMLDERRRTAFRTTSEHVARQQHGSAWSLRGVVEHVIETFAGAAPDVSLRVTSYRSSAVVASAESRLLALADEAYAAIIASSYSRSIAFWLDYSPGTVTFTIRREGRPIPQPAAQRLDAVLDSLHRRASADGGRCVAAESGGAGRLECSIHVPIAPDGTRSLD